MFFNAYFIAYVVSPKLCHSFVGYLEEEAVKTYTHVISDMDKGRLPEWSTKKARILSTSVTQGFCTVDRICFSLPFPVNYSLVTV